MKVHIQLILVILIGIIGAVLITFIIDSQLKTAKNISYEQGYKDACKDFYQGHLKYDLVTNPDGTREWKKIE